MRLVKEASLFSKVGLCQMSVVAVLYYAVTTVLNILLQVSPGVEFRLSTFIAVVPGLLFGLPAAVGTAVGNIISQIQTGNSLDASMVGTYYNFLLSYGMYRLWYGYQSKKATLYVYNNRTFIKFVLLALFGGFNFCVLWESFIGLFYRNAELSHILITFCNNFAFPVALGIPTLLLYAHWAKVEYVRPRDKESIYNGWHKDAALVLIMIELFFIVRLALDNLTSTYMLFTSIAGSALWLYVILLPSTYETNTEEVAGFNSLASQFTMYLFTIVDLLIFLYVLSIAFYEFSDIKYWYNYHNWAQVMRDFVVCLFFVIAGVYFFLLHMERSWIYRIKQLSFRMQKYLKTGELAALCTDNIALLSGKADKMLNEIDLMEYSLHKMGVDVADCIVRLDSVIKEQENTATEMRIASSIQNSVLPDIATLQHALKDYVIQGGMQTAKVVGGDLFNSFLIDEDHLAIIMADVSGKGLPASLFMMITQTLLKQNLGKLDPVAAMERTNDTLAASNKECLFVTTWIGLVELSTGKIIYVNAGHNPPLLKVAPEAEPQWLEEVSGPVLGLMGGMPYASYTCELPQGGSILLYTDGLNEAEDKSGDLYGNDRLIACFARTTQGEEIIADIKSFVNGAEQSDDMTYLILTRSKEVAS